MTSIEVHNKTQQTGKGRVRDPGTAMGSNLRTCAGDFLLEVSTEARDGGRVAGKEEGQSGSQAMAGALEQLFRKLHHPSSLKSQMAHPSWELPLPGHPPVPFRSQNPRLPSNTQLSQGTGSSKKPLPPTQQQPPISPGPPCSRSWLGCTWPHLEQSSEFQQLKNKHKLQYFQHVLPTLLIMYLAPALQKGT